MTRQRCMLIARRRDTIRATSPFNMAAFGKFKMSVCMPPDTFWCAPAEVVSEKRRKIAAACGAPSASEVRVKDWVQGDFRRLVNHAQNCMHDSRDCLPHGTVDPKQSERFGTSKRTVLSAFQTTSHPYSFDHQRSMLPVECLVAMGVDLYNMSSQPYPGAAFLKSLPERSQMRMAGNTIHGTVMFAVLLVMFSVSAYGAESDSDSSD